MTALFLYGAVLLMAASVIVNRIGQRRMAAARKLLATEEGTLRSLDHLILDQARALGQVKQRNESLDDQIHDARLAVEHLTEKFEQARAAPTEKYHVFDRLDARPGTIWSLDVRRGEEAPQDSRMAAAWPAPRTYLIVAANPREAVDRAAQRFPRNQGFDIGPATVCHLFKTKRSGESGNGDRSGDRPAGRSADRGAA